ncbi:MAG: trypsin-like peptidase domain-containing protein [Prosthecobacter sp.]
METSILIRRLTGTGKGKEETLHTQEISLGTGSNNTVRFDPSWDRGVATSHARVWRDEGGVWWLQDAGSSTGTFVNGQRITTRRKVGGPTVIELGQNGPKVEVMLPAMAEAASLPGSSAKRGNSRRPLLPLAFAALVVLGLAGYFFLGSGFRFGGGDSDQQIEMAARRLESAVGKVIMINEKGQILGSGTAWAVGPGIFATNGHISAPASDTLDTGGAVFIAINKDPARKYRVQQAITHPLYGANTLNAQGRTAELATYDVGLLIIKEHHPVTFKLAAPESVRQLDAGRRVAFIGFPAENLANSGSDNERPVATMQTGIVTAVTDYWGSQADVGERLLVQHNLPSTGGASGSPIFDQNGDVVAVLCAINLTFSLPTQTKVAIEDLKQQIVTLLEGQLKDETTSKEDKEKAVLEARARLERLRLKSEDFKRTPSAALINFAQRADVLQELLDAYHKAASE